MKAFALSLILLLVMVACGDVADDSAPGKCRAFVSVYCARVVACGSELTSQQCADAFASVVDCGRAAGVSPSYDRCLTELAAFDCSIFDGGATLPASCDHAIVATKP